MPDAMQLIVREASKANQIAVMTAEGLSEFYQESESTESLVGAIFLGRVERVLPDMKAAFVRIGLSQNGFLPIRETESFHQKADNKPLMSGQEILVQVKKNPKGDKGAFLTRDIALPAQYVLLMPCNQFVGMSKRIEDEQERSEAKLLGQQLSGGRFGLIVRHAALFARQQDVKAEADALWEQWQALKSKAEYLKAPALLHREPSMLSVLVRDYAARYDIEISSTQPKLDELSIPWKQLTQADMDALWLGKRIERQLAQAIGRRIELKQGGSLVIDEREALSTIDVNSGSNVFASEDTDLPLAQNLIAIPEIARQIRLRNLSGILLIDFIDMKTDEQRQAVLAAMEDALAEDRVKTVVHGFTNLGLLEMTRKRTRDTLRGMMTMPCKACHENGRVPTT